MKNFYNYFSILLVLIPVYGFSQLNVQIEELKEFPNNQVSQINNYNVVDGKLYFFGGYDSGSSPYVCSNKITEYDILTNSYSELNFNLPYGIFDYCGASYYNGKFYLSPGFSTGNTNGWGTHKKLIEVDMNAEVSTETHMFTGDNIWDMSNIEANGKIYFFGGHNGSDQTGIYEYNPTSDQLELVANMNYKRNAPSIVLGSDGWIYILDDWESMINIERFSPEDYTVQDLGLQLPINMADYYWHISNENSIYLFESNTANAKVYKFNYESLVIENTGLVINTKMVNRCFIDPDNENVIYGFKYEDGAPSMLCKLSLEGYNSISNHEFLDKLKVYPNPATNEIHFSNYRNSIQSLQIINSFGLVVSQYQNFDDKIDISPLKPGLYTLLFRGKSNDILGTKKIIKQN